MHALPRRHAEGAYADGAEGVGSRAARRAVEGHERCVDLWPRPGGVEPADHRDAIFSRSVRAEGGVPMSDMISFELDGKPVVAQADETIWQVAKRLGTEIPHLCYSPEPGYRADG